METLCTSGWLPNILSSIPNGFSAATGIIASAFFGGLFAGLFTNHFESKRRTKDRRIDKYNEHRNSLVQIEQELIPLRVNMSRNIHSLQDALENTNSLNIRFILRFYKLFISTGLGLKILDIELINKYAQLYSAIESLNSDFEYISGMVNSVRENAKSNLHDESLIKSYTDMLPYLKEACEDADQKTIELLALCKVTVDLEDKKISLKYIKDGKAIVYRISKTALFKKIKKIEDEENPTLHKNEKLPKFFAPFLDLKKVERISFRS